jgi:hypothetical protein
MEPGDARHETAASVWPFLISAQNKLIPCVSVWIQGGGVVIFFTQNTVGEIPTISILYKF